MKEVLLYKEWLTVWKKQKQGYVRESTLANYSTAITSHILPVLGERRITDITERCLQETALFWLHHGRCDGMGGLSERTVRNLVTIVKITLKAVAIRRVLQLKSILLLITLWLMLAEQLLLRK